MPIKKIVTPCLALFVLLASACSTDVGKSIKIPEDKLALYSAMSLSKALGLIEASIAKARNNKMPFLAPHYFNQANDIFTALQTAQGSTEKDAWKMQIAKAHTLLEKGEAVSAQVREHFPRELELKGFLDEFGAAHSYPDDYDKVIDKFSDLIERVELGKASHIERDQNELIKAMQLLDIKAVQYFALHESDMTIQNIEIGRAHV
jgi:hypothetical protein